MGLTSLLLSIIAILALVFLGVFGIFISLILGLLALIFGLIGIGKKENTAIAGVVISILVLIVDIWFLVTVF